VPVFVPAFVAVPVLEALICWRTVALNCPLIPARLNMCEKANKGRVGFVGSGIGHWTRIKYPAKLGPMVGSTVKTRLEEVATGTAGWIGWSRVCCCELPAKRAKLHAPHCCSVGGF